MKYKPLIKVTTNCFNYETINKCLTGKYFRRDANTVDQKDEDYVLQRGELQYRSNKMTFLELI